PRAPRRRHALLHQRPAPEPDAPRPGHGGAAPRPPFPPPPHVLRLAYQPPGPHLRHRPLRHRGPPGSGAPPPPAPTTAAACAAPRHSARTRLTMELVFACGNSGPKMAVGVVSFQPSVTAMTRRMYSSWA